LPDTWGLLVPDKSGKLRVKTPATRLQEPMPITRKFLAAILRKTVESAPVFTDVDAEVEKLVQQRLQPERDRITKDFEWKHRNDLESAEKLRKSVEAFEAASGIRIDRYSDYFSTEIGEAVKAIRQAGKDLSIKRKFADAERVMSRFLDDLREQQAALDRIWPEPEEAKEHAAC
jgi:hypothetical protein